MLPVPARSSQLELLDAPTRISADLASNLRDIRRLNVAFGGTALAVQCVRSVLGGLPRASLLDVATGSADIPRSLHDWASRAGIDLKITACDISPDVLEEAARHTAGIGIALRRADALALPWTDGAFDVVLCCLALHHFDRADAIVVLSELWRVARIGIVVTDLYRSYPAYFGTILATRIVARNGITRHDGPLSVLRAYTADELTSIAADAGIRQVSVRRRPFFRQTLIGLKSGAESG